MNTSVPPQTLYAVCGEHRNHNHLRQALRWGGAGGGGYKYVAFCLEIPLSFK